MRIRLPLDLPAPGLGLVLGATGIIFILKKSTPGTFFIYRGPITPARF